MLTGVEEREEEKTCAVVCRSTLSFTSVAIFEII